MQFLNEGVFISYWIWFPLLVIGSFSIGYTVTDIYDKVSEGWGG